MKTDKLNSLIHDFLHGDMSDEIQRRFRRWMIAPSDRKAKDSALFHAWTELLKKTSEDDYRQKLSEMHRRIDAAERTPQGRILSLKRFVAVAALLALVICGEYLFLQNRYTRSRELCLVTAQGSKGEFLLPDGTRVWLNGDSRLSYPETFDSDVREVKLDGEAFFQVSHDEHHPFVVDMNLLQVEVLGTEFDVRHHRGHRFAEAILKSGSIRIRSSGLKQPVILTPNQRFVFDAQSGTGTLSEVAAEDYSSWVARRLIFANKSLESILVNLERWYGVRFRLEDSIDLSAKLSFRIEYESLEETLRLISMIAPVRYEIRGEEILLSPR